MNSFRIFQYSELIHHNSQEQVCIYDWILWRLSMLCEKASRLLIHYQICLQYQFYDHHYYIIIHFSTNPQSHLYHQ